MHDQIFLGRVQRSSQTPSASVHLPLTQVVPSPWSLVISTLTLQTALSEDTPIPQAGCGQRRYWFCSAHGRVWKRMDRAAGPGFLYVLTTDGAAGARELGSVALPIQLPSLQQTGSQDTSLEGPMPLLCPEHVSFPYSFPSSSPCWSPRMSLS